MSKVIIENNIDAKLEVESSYEGTIFIIKLTF